jgi:hypothetical protein
MVGGYDLRSAIERRYRRQTEAATQLYDALAGEVPAGQVARQGYGARPQVGPVWQAFVAFEVRLVYEGVGGGGVGDAVGAFADRYGGLGEARAAFEV